MSQFLNYFYIFITIGFTVYGQLILKWRIVKYGAFPTDILGKLKFLFTLILDPGIFSGLIAAVLAAFAWMAAMTKFDLSHAYPFTSLSFVIVLLLSGWFLNEPISFQKILGIGFIVLGTLVVAHG